MTNQNRRPGEVEIRLETPQASETTNSLGNFQFLIVRDMEEFDFSKKKGARNSAKGKCQAVRAYIPNEPFECSIVGTCKTTSGYSMSEIKTTETNVLLTSNPSKTKGDYSEDCENTQSSQLSMSTGVGDSSEVDSRMTFKCVRQPCCRRSSRTTIHSSQNGQTDETDQTCVLSGREQVGDGTQENLKEEGAFPTECFTQLYKRIEALEDLLQRGLGTAMACRTVFRSGPIFQESFKKESCNCKEKSKPQKSPQQNKVKFMAPEKPKSAVGCEVITLPEFIQEVLDSNSSSIPAASTNEEKESVGTDSEIQSIKKRVIALEEKLKMLEPPARKSNIREKSPSKNSFALIKLEKKNQGQPTTEKRNDSAAQTNFDEDSFQKSEIYFLNTDLNDSADRKIKSKVTKKPSRKYKKIKGECSSALISKKSSHSRNGSVTVFNCLSEQSDTRTHSFESTLCRYPLSNDSDRSKQTAAAVVYLRCQNASVAWPPEACPERKRQNVKDLCRKVPVTNLVLNQFTEGDNEIDDPHAFGDCKFPSSLKKTYRSKKRSRGYIVSRHSPTGVHSFHRRHTAWTVTKRSSRHHPFLEELAHRRHKSRNREKETKKEKSPRKTRHTGAKEITQEGDKLKIPVLFKEICKPMKPVQKISNFSMRFVLVENDPSNPLRSLMEKLSKGKSQTKEEQYVFGVSKCSCDESRGAPAKICRRGGSSKPAAEGLIHSILGAGQKTAGGGLLKFRPESLYI